MVKLESITINLGIVSVTFKDDELDQTLKSILDEMRDITTDLGESERRNLRTIMGSSTRLTVEDLYANFQRETAEHETLRRLRDAQFIRPVPRGQWKIDSKIEVKAFGRLMWDKLGEDVLFSQTSND